jgi:hypothetical protein
MTDFTLTEINLLLIYSGDTRLETIQNLLSMRQELDADEYELRDMTDTVLNKLHTMTDAEFDAVDLFQAFEAAYDG